MKNIFFKYLVLSFTLVCLLVLSVSCENKTHVGDDHGHDAGHDEHEEHVEKGSHGGRIFEHQDFALELQIFETGVEPQFRIFAYDHGQPLEPSKFSVDVSTKRLNGEVTQFSFEKVDDFWISNEAVVEPHSFDMSIKARFEGEQMIWDASSHEGRTSISDSVAIKSGIKTSVAGSRSIVSNLNIRGKIFPSEDKIAHVIPRFSGVVKESHKHIGDRVEQGELLAIIESNESLQPFNVTSQISGTVINGHLVIGEFIPENQWVYMVADLSEVWADFFVPLREQGKVKIGQKISISSPASEAPDKNTYQGAVSYVAPYVDEKSQSQLIRVVVTNEDQQFLPGMFITGELVVEEQDVAVAVARSAVQTFRDMDVVFVKVGETYEVAPVEFGKSDDRWLEVTSGLKPGDTYVTENSYLIKADILKSGAGHDH